MHIASLATPVQRARFTSLDASSKLTRLSTLFVSLLGMASLSACMVVVVPPEHNQAEKSAMPASSASVSTAACIGENSLPAQVAASFVEVQDAALLAQAVQPAGKGGLCQAKVYQSTEPVMIYRAWNSTNPGSRIGSWWAFKKASGSVSQYRRDYEICTQYSPLDRLAQCKLKTGSLIVVGTGQSAQCDQYLTYPASASRQIYMPKEAANSSVNNCEDFDAEFAWKARPEVRSAQ